MVQLAAEAGVKRWLLAHKHRDLAERFQTGAFAGPSGYHEPSPMNARRRIVAFFDRHLRS